MKIKLLTVVILLLACSPTYSQDYDMMSDVEIHQLASEYFEDSRSVWVSLPVEYDSTLNYPVIYVMDAEWRFDLVRSVVNTMNFSREVGAYIVVGIPNRSKQLRSLDLTFTITTVRPDGKAIESQKLNALNTGGGDAMKYFLTKEVLPFVNEQYSTNGDNIAIGHSLGGYFLCQQVGAQFFNSLVLIDPSIWYNEGATLDYLANSTLANKQNIFVAFQNTPVYHSEKIKGLITELKEHGNIQITYRNYPDESHHTIYIQALIDSFRAILTN